MCLTADSQHIKKPRLVILVYMKRNNTITPILGHDKPILFIQKVVVQIQSLPSNRQKPNRVLNTLNVEFKDKNG